jgi:hypothetical protein
MGYTVLKSANYTQYTLTSTLTAIPTMSITIPEDGNYLVIGNIATYSFDTGTVASHVYVKLAVDGTRITPSGGGCGISTSDIVKVPTSILNFVYLKKDQVLTVHVAQDADDNGVILATAAGNFATYIEAEKRD